MPIVKIERRRMFTTSSTYTLTFENVVATGISCPLGALSTAGSWSRSSCLCAEGYAGPVSTRIIHLGMRTEHGAFDGFGRWILSNVLALIRKRKCHACGVCVCVYGLCVAGDEIARQVDGGSLA